MMRSAAVCIARDEAWDIAEWIIFHKSIGFDDVIIYNHLSIDSTSDVAKKAGAIVVEWSETTSPQGNAYKHALANQGQNYDWLAFLDADEFFLPLADMNVGCFLDRIEAFHEVVINWRCYGSSGHVLRPAGLVTDNFLKRAPDDYGANRHTKAFVRPRCVKRFINAHYFEVYGKCVHPDGSTPIWEKPGKTTFVPKDTIARINHYYTRSREHYNRRLTRPNVSKGKQFSDRFAETDINDIYDPVIPDLFGNNLDNMRQRNI